MYTYVHKTRSVGDGPNGPEESGGYREGILPLVVLLVLLVKTVGELVGQPSHLLALLALQAVAFLQGVRVHARLDVGADAPLQLLDRQRVELDGEVAVLRDERRGPGVVGLGDVPG